MTTVSRPGISAFFPCYNDAGTIATMVVLTDVTLRTITDDYEVIVVNDGSPDHSAHILEELRRHYPRLRVVTHEGNKGYGAALRSGFAAARKELVLYTDGDAQYDPREFKMLYDALTPEDDMVQGYKISRNDPFHRKIIGRIYHHVVSVLFGLPYRDVDCDFRLIRRRVLDSFRLESSTGHICVELMANVSMRKYKVREVAVHHYHRAYGTSQFFNFPRVSRTLVGLFGLWRRLNRMRRTFAAAAGSRES